MHGTFYLFLALILAACKAPGGSYSQERTDAAHQPVEVRFAAPDGVELFADWFEQSPTASTILLFHQGGPNARGEYGPLIPLLLKQGYNILATDLRLGGQLYGSYNRTVAGYSEAESYCEAQVDVNAAVDFARQKSPDSRIVLWGSSYSGTLAIRVAAERQREISAVLGFSPAGGEAMTGCQSTEFFEHLQIPLLVARPSTELEIESARIQFDVAQQHGHTVRVTGHGIHGSSMLVPERAGADVSDHMTFVLSFIAEALHESDR